jgi:hypothetical protein
MLPFLAVAPILWGAKKLYDYATDDDYETSTYSDKSEREAETRKASQKEKKDKIKKDIKAYKNKQVKRLKDKYGADIKFIDKGFSVNGDGPFGFQSSPKIKHDYHIEIITSDNLIIKKSIKELDNETEEMIKLIGELEVKKYETTN